MHIFLKFCKYCMQFIPVTLSRYYSLSFNDSIRFCNDEINLFPEFDMRKFGRRFLVQSILTAVYSPHTLENSSFNCDPNITSNTFQLWQFEFFDLVFRNCCVFLNFVHLQFEFVHKMCWNFSSSASVNDSMTEEAIHKWVQFKQGSKWIRNVKPHQTPLTFKSLAKLSAPILFWISGTMEPTRWWLQLCGMTSQTPKQTRSCSAWRISRSMRNLRSLWRMSSESIIEL